MRLLFQTLPVVHGSTVIKVHGPNDCGEYRARAYVDGKPYEPADCFEADMDDACGTALAMRQDAIRLASAHSVTQGERGTCN